MRVFFFGAGSVTQNTQLGYLFWNGVSYLDHSMRVLFSKRVELLRSLKEGIFFRSGLSYSDHSMRVFVLFCFFDGG